MLLNGKTGIMFGVANKRSLAWAIDRRAAENARESRSHTRAAAGREARELAATLDNPLVPMRRE